jgi:hypothetical protein
MRNSLRRAGFALLTLLVLSGSARALFETRETKLQAVKTVGIISAVGDRFVFTKAGLTGFDNTSRSVSIASWALDDFFAQQATAMLSGRFEVKPVSYPRATFAAISESPLRPVELIRGDQFKKLVETEVTPQGLDALVVITRAKADLGAGGRKVEGIGLVTYSTMTESYSAIHALYEIRVVDGKTFDVIEKLAAGPIDNSTDLRLAGPSRLLDNGIAVGSDAAGDENLHRAVVDLITRSLPVTLEDMRLR